MVTYKQKIDKLTTELAELDERSLAGEDVLKDTLRVMCGLESIVEARTIQAKRELASVKKEVSEDVVL